MPSEKDAQRDANIKKKEDERKAKNEEIKANKAKLQAERGAKADEAAATAQAEADKKKAVEDKRAAAIKEKEGKRAGAGGKPKGSKYSKSDVIDLKKVFDQYDRDKSGAITLTEFSTELGRKKEASGPRAGEKSSREQRAAKEGISIFDLAESTFHEMDVDGNGEVSFREMLKLMFKNARADELDLMMSWVAPEPEPEPEPKQELSDDAKAMINSIFKLYDKDKSGSLTVSELKKALEKTGIEVEEVKQMLDEFDTDGNKELNKEEFRALMESTGAFDDM